MSYEHRFMMVMILDSPDRDATYILDRNLKHAGFDFYTEGPVKITEYEEEE